MVLGPTGSGSRRAVAGRACGGCLWISEGQGARSCNKHTKTDRLDSRVLARLPLLHPEGLKPIDSLGPADPLKRAVRHRTSLVKRRAASMLRLDALVELLGPAYADVLGTGDYNKTALMVLERFADPKTLRARADRSGVGLQRLAHFMSLMVMMRATARANCATRWWMNRSVLRRS